MWRFLFPAFLVLIFSSSLSQAQYYNAVDWGTYYNDSLHYPFLDFSNYDLIDQVIVDGNNPENIYVCGKTYSPSNQALLTCSGLQSISLGTSVGYFAKYDRCGNLKWSTFFGDYVQSVAIDQQGSKTIVYAAGHIKPMIDWTAYSCDGNPAPVFQTIPADQSESFIAMYEDDDTAATLLRFTYLGGSNDTISLDNILDIAVYKHSVFGTGLTNSANIHHNAATYADTVYGGGGDGFFCEFDSILSTLKFFSYIGGTENDRGHDIKLRSTNGNHTEVFICGTAGSATGIGSGTGFDTTWNGNTDAFVSKWIDMGNGDAPFIQEWGTYIGGTDYEHGRSAFLDTSGNIFLTGYTSSTDMPVTLMSYDQTLGATQVITPLTDAFVIKVSNTGANVWCTYLGGDNDDNGNGLAHFTYQGTSYIVLAGRTKSTSGTFPLVNPIQDELNGNNTDDYEDAFISILSDVSDTQHLVFSTYLGGTYAEGVKTGISYHPSVATGPNGELYFVVATQSSDIPESVGNEFENQLRPYSGTANEGSEAFIAKLIDVNNNLQYNCAPIYTGNDSDKPPLNREKLSMYPDPFANSFTVQFYSYANKQRTLEVFSELGKLMYSSSIILHKGTNNIPVCLSSSASGIYLVRIVGDEEIISSKLMKE